MSASCWGWWVIQVAADTDKLKRLDNFFPSAFTNKISQAPVLRDTVQGKEEQPAVVEGVDEVRDYFRGLMLNKSVQPSGLHRWVRRQLVDVLARLLSIIFLKLWRSGKISDNWSKANVAPTFKKVWNYELGNYRPISLILVPRENHGMSPLGTNLWHRKVEKVLGTASMDLPCLTHLIAFCDKAAGLTNKGWHLSWL